MTVDDPTRATYDLNGSKNRCGDGLRPKNKSGEKTHFLIGELFASIFTRISTRERPGIKSAMNFATKYG